MIKLIILLTMIYCHILDDFHLQGIMKYMKQKSWWQEQTTDEKYRHDYLIVLALHAFSWTFAILLPIIAYTLINDIYVNIYTFLLVFGINWTIHFIIDNEKANKLSINLVTDQFIHLIQIIITWIILL
ncbi:MAG: hypothetical protein IJZ79_03665 [Bacilli bacterium]|nr:hypothetical protein [Bacilli bacterium]MBQ8218827.1 hypothetical protein [Bacilli bacterium]